MTRVVSTKLSNEEHGCLLKIANECGQTISEFTRKSILASMKVGHQCDVQDDATTKLQDLLHVMQHDRTTITEHNEVES
jgi:hypothetical protein